MDDKEGIVQSNNTWIVEIYFWKEPTCGSLEGFKKKFGQNNEHWGNLNFIIKNVINVIM